MSSSTSKLPKRSFASEPVHQRLAEICRTAILAGKYGPGEKFPSERELAENFKVSRATANKVIASLIAENFLELRSGIGTFVAKVRTFESSLRETKSFTDQTLASGMVPRTEVLAFGLLNVDQVPVEVIAGLGGEARGFSTTQPYLYFERLRLADGVPLIIEQRWTFSALFPDLASADLEGSFYHILETRYGIRLSVESHSIAAVNLGPLEAQRLQVPEGSAALMVIGAGYRDPEDPIWYQRLFYRGDRYVLSNRIQSERNGVGITLQFRQQLQNKSLLWQP